MIEPSQLDERMRPLRERFVRRAIVDHEAIRVALAAGDYATVRDICHRLAGNAGLFGFADLGTVARLAEEEVLSKAEQGVCSALLEELLGRLVALSEDTSFSS
ncbi:Hpt domain-containing protein [Sphingomonas sp.]|jgi:HPt (histidine-containing phosphotransfer) domain-containing protein|uniref:Hpt domain-containing protein n=1 Tax=Sphingomonas sp. TaxID=28214 RepID=UPI0026054CD8|nr:Hpt domain-containing protein [Sphingomonas sp.]MDF2604639.1 hypothetical protein [Sphingomonas sp.]